MQLNPTLASLLEAYELEHLHALVNWLEPETIPVTVDLPDESQPLESSAPKEEPIMSTLTPSLSVISSRPSKVAMPLDDLIEFSLLNEFGADFQGKSCFEWLRGCLTQRFSPEQ